MNCALEIPSQQLLILGCGKKYFLLINLANLNLITNISMAEDINAMLQLDENSILVC